MRTIASVITAAAILSGGAAIIVTAQTSAHVVQTPQEGQWGPAPPLVPPGAQIAGRGRPRALALHGPPEVPRELLDSRALASHGRTRRGCAWRPDVRDGRQADENGERQQDAWRRRLRVDAGEDESLRVHHWGRNRDRPLTARARSTSRM